MPQDRRKTEFAITGLEAPEAGHVRLEKGGAIGWIIMDHPASHNALTSAMWRSLPALLCDAEADSAIRAIVLRGREQGVLGGATSPNSTQPARAAGGQRM